MPDAGEIKAKVTIEYDSSGIDKAKEDLASLADIGGNLEASAGSAGESLAGLDEQMGKGAESARTFSSALEQLPKATENITSAVSDATDAIVEQQGAVEDIQQAYEEALPKLADNIKATGDAWGVAGNNMQVFQEALSSTDSPFQMIYDHLDKTGQSIEDFTSSIGTSNADLFHSMSADWYYTNSIMDETGKTFQAAGKNVGQGFSAIASSAQDADRAVSNFLGRPDISSAFSTEGINKFGGAGNVLAGPLEELKSYQSIGFGEAFSNAGEGIMGALNDIAMPLMAVQMIAMAVGQVGQAIYSAAADAEGPAAHSFGTFTGTVDALGQTAAKAGQQFSEAFGQGVLPSLNAMNNEVSQGQPGLDQFGNFLGGLVGVGADLIQIGTGTDVVGGFKGLVNTGASLMGIEQPYQGPGPAQQAQVDYQKSFVNMPQTVIAKGYQVQQQADEYFQMASDPQYLADQDRLSAAQQAYQRAQTIYNQRHYISPQQALMQYQEQQYDTQQEANYQQQMQSGGLFSGYDPIGYWGGVFNGIFGGGSGPKTSALASLFGGGGGGPQTSVWDSLFGGGPGLSIPLGSSGFWGGIGDWFSHLFGGGGGSSPQPFQTAGGCFPAGTKVLLSNGDTKPIEMLQIGEEVASHDGAQPITDCITYPSKQTYELVFADGATLLLTDSHPVSTTEGWKSISPESTKRENPDLAVTRLGVWDIVHTLQGPRELLSIRKDRIVQVYNITVATTHTYYANGVLVHNAKGAQIGQQVADQIGDIQLPKLDLSGIATALTGSISAIQLPHLDLSGMTAGLASAFGSITLPSIPDVGGMINGALSGMFGSISMPSVPDVGGMINGAMSGMFGAISLPSIPNIGGEINGALSGMFGGISLPSVPDLGGMLNGAMSGMFGGINLPSVPELGGMLSGAMSGMFGGISLPSVPNLGAQISSAMSGMFSGISLPSIPFFAKGIEGFSGGMAVVGDEGPELVHLPGGSSVYPLTTGSGIGGSVSPISLGSSGGGNMPSSVNVILQIDSQTVLSAIGMPMAQTVRASTGYRGF